MEKLTCTRCGAQMKYFASEKLQLGKTGWVIGDLPNLFAGALDVEIFVCPECKKLEFYAAEQIEDDIPQKTCPECGTVHDFDYPKCPKCKYDYYK